MTVPAIRSYEIRPPVGGWGIEYEYKGQKFPFTGGWRDILRKLRNLYQKNGERLSEDDAMDILNNIWCGRDPERCMTPAQRTVAQKRAGVRCGRCHGRPPSWRGRS